MTAPPPATVVVWMNADAELELADPDYRRSPRMAELCRQLADRLQPDIERWVAARLPAARCLVVPPIPRPEHPPVRARAPVQALAWAATDQARAALTERGWSMAPGADAESASVRRANHRATAARCAARWSADDPLPGSSFATTVHAVEGAVASAPPSETGATRWLLKRALGFAGRWRKVVQPGPLEAADRTWIEASMHAYGGGLQVEPLVRIEREWAIHGWIDARGEAAWAEPRTFATAADGSWTPRDGDPPIEEEAAAPAEAAARTVAAMLAAPTSNAAGYRGPVGVDGYVWIDARGTRRLRAISDVNARCTTQWFAATRGLAGIDLAGR